MRKRRLQRDRQEKRYRPPSQQRARQDNSPSPGIQASGFDRDALLSHLVLKNPCCLGNETCGLASRPVSGILHSNENQLDCSDLILSLHACKLLRRVTSLNLHSPPHAIRQSVMTSTLRKSYNLMDPQCRVMLSGLWQAGHKVARRSVKDATLF